MRTKEVKLEFVLRICPCTLNPAEAYQGTVWSVKASIIVDKVQEVEKHQLEDAEKGRCDTHLRNCEILGFVPRITQWEKDSNTRLAYLTHSRDKMTGKRLTFCTDRQVLEKEEDPGLPVFVQ